MDKHLQLSHTYFAQRGMNMIELMLAMTIGLFLLLGLTTVFTNSSQTQRELEYTGQLVENGRYATDFVFQDIRLAGSYGYLVSLETPAALPTDACSTANALTDDAVKLPVQGFDTNASGTRAALSGNCSTLLSNANLKPGSDVLVVRRANTQVAPAGAPTVGLPYIQASANDFDVQVGVSGATLPTDTADNNSPTLQYANGSTAETREFKTHIYFVAPCTVGLGANGVCNGSANEDTVPALKRLYLTSETNTTKFLIEPLVEGVEFFQVEYGIDTSPTSVDSTTGEEGDGVPDSYVTLPASATQWSQVVAVRLFLLVRSTNQSKGYTDEKVYKLNSTGVGSFSYGPANDNSKRHVFTVETQIVNVAGRREIPI